MLVCVPTYVLICFMYVSVCVYICLCVLNVSVLKVMRVIYLCYMATESCHKLWPYACSHSANALYEFVFTCFEINVCTCVHAHMCVCNVCERAFMIHEHQLPKVSRDLSTSVYSETLRDNTFIFIKHTYIYTYRLGARSKKMQKIK